METKSETEADVPSTTNVDAIRAKIEKELEERRQANRSSEAKTEEAPKKEEAPKAEPEAAAEAKDKPAKSDDDERRRKLEDDVRRKVEEELKQRQAQRSNGSASSTDDKPKAEDTKDTKAKAPSGDEEKAKEPAKKDSKTEEKAKDQPKPKAKPEAKEEAKKGKAGTKKAPVAGKPSTKKNGEAKKKDDAEKADGGDDDDKTRNRTAKKKKKTTMAKTVGAFDSEQTRRNMALKEEKERIDAKFRKRNLMIYYPAITVVTVILAILIFKKKSSKPDEPETPAPATQEEVSQQPVDDKPAPTRKPRGSNKPFKVLEREAKKLIASGDYEAAIEKYRDHASKNPDDRAKCEDNIDFINTMYVEKKGAEGSDEWRDIRDRVESIAASGNASDYKHAITLLLEFKWQNPGEGHRADDLIVDYGGQYYLQRGNFPRLPRKPKNLPVYEEVDNVENGRQPDNGRAPWTTNEEVPANNSWFGTDDGGGGGGNGNADPWGTGGGENDAANEPEAGGDGGGGGGAW